MPFTLPELSYGYADLEPFIDAKTMELHHSKHHQAYIDKANAALEKYPEYGDKSIEEILTDLESLPEDIKTIVRNNGGGHANHSLFWLIMKPGAGGEPSGELADDIKETFGSFNDFKNKFTEAATGQFGSGWAWLVVDPKGELVVMSTPNQDSPLSVGSTPILGLDVWEHAYYLNYQNRRPEYVEKWWNIVNWEEVQSRWQKLQG